ncbi:hypothetical protein M8C21_008146 [Ambrosia artemisiifolia]|uniref:RNA polymerase Rpb2 domain-containing protein n=1 Tax=Ambrosia artemisiifolia TaxID=4212 RepID=A0AAD5BQC6_AMBAR|nr:hypothetical protein M8C21_008146 [Ambrosia artemisiifolia]
MTEEYALAEQQNMFSEARAKIIQDFLPTGIQFLLSLNLTLKLAGRARIVLTQSVNLYNLISLYLTICLAVLIREARTPCARLIETVISSFTQFVVWVWSGSRYTDVYIGRASAIIDGVTEESSPQKCWLSDKTYQYCQNHLNLYQPFTFFVTLVESNVYMFHLNLFPKTKVPIMLVMKAMGMTTDQEVVHMLGRDPQYANLLLPSIEAREHTSHLKCVYGVVILRRMMDATFVMPQNMNF